MQLIHQRLDEACSRDCQYSNCFCCSRGLSFRRAQDLTNSWTRLESDEAAVLRTLTLDLYISLQTSNCIAALQL